MKNICEAIKEVLINSKEIILENNSADLQGGGMPFDVDRCVKSLDWCEVSMVGRVVSATKMNGVTFIQKYIPYTYVGITAEENDPYAMVYAVTKALESGTNVCVYISSDKNCITTAFVLGLIGRVADGFDLTVDLETDKEAFEKELQFDKTLIIGSRVFYNKFVCVTPKEYIPFGVTDVICMDEALYENVASQLDGVNLYTKFECDKATQVVRGIEEAVALVNLSGDRYRTVLFSQNESCIRFFTSFIKSDSVIVNTYNEEKELPNISQYSFIRLVNYLA